jgi:hypothetical protein
MTPATLIRPASAIEQHPKSLCNVITDSVQRTYFELKLCSNLISLILAEHFISFILQLLNSVKTS